MLVDNSVRILRGGVTFYGAGEFQRIYDNNASLRAAVKDFDELIKCIESLSEVNRANVYNILSGTDSEKIAELTDVIKNSGGDGKKISEFLSVVEATEGVSEAEMNKLTLPLALNGDIE